MAAPSKPKGKWDAKDHAYEFLTKQPGTHWDAKDHAWEGPPQKGPNPPQSNSAPPAKSAPPTSSAPTKGGSSKFDPIPILKSDSARTKGIKAMLNKKRAAQQGKG